MLKKLHLSEGEKLMLVVCLSLTYYSAFFKIVGLMAVPWLVVIAPITLFSLWYVFCLLFSWFILTIIF